MVQLESGLWVGVEQRMTQGSKSAVLVIGFDLQPPCRCEVTVRLKVVPAAVTVRLEVVPAAAEQEALRREAQKRFLEQLKDYTDLTMQVLEWNVLTDDATATHCVLQDVEKVTEEGPKKGHGVLEAVVVPTK